MNDTATISILPKKEDNCDLWRVDCIFTGLKNEKQALIIADYLTKMLCGNEIIGTEQ